MYGIIYKITNQVNGKIYIGLTKQKMKTRFRAHYNIIQSNIKRNKPITYLQQAMLKYGKENFSIEQIDVADTKEELEQKEIYWIAHYNSTDRSIGYNITEGGEGGDTCSHCIWVTDGTTNKYIKKDEEIPDGFKKGRTIWDSLKNSLVGKVWINNNIEQKLILKSEADTYLQNGWELGMLYRGDEWKENVKNSHPNLTPEQRENLSKIKKEWYQKHPGYLNDGNFKKGQEAHNKGKIWVTNGIINKYINKDELEEFIKNNSEWRKGCIQKRKKRDNRNDR